MSLYKGKGRCIQNKDNVHVYKRGNKSDINPVEIEIKSYTLYIIFLKHDGGNNSLLAVIYPEAEPKLTEIKKVGNAVSAELSNRVLKLMSVTPYWNYYVLRA